MSQLCLPQTPHADKQMGGLNSFSCHGGGPPAHIKDFFVLYYGSKVILTDFIITGSMYWEKTLLSLNNSSRYLFYVVAYAQIHVKAIL